MSAINFSKVKACAVSGVLAGLLMPLSASAISIQYTVASLGGNSYQYNYTVINDGSLPSSADVEGFQVFFDYDDYDNLAVVAAPGPWDALVFQPDAGFLLDGVFDALADPGPGIANGNLLGGFSVSFDWLPGGTPGDQPFEIYDANDFSVLESGNTTLSPVPVPAAVWLFGSALAGLGALRRQQRTDVKNV